jgi:hypothetical protein
MVAGDVFVAGVFAAGAVALGWGVLISRLLGRGQGMTTRFRLLEAGAFFLLTALPVKDALRAQNHGWFWALSWLTAIHFFIAGAVLLPPRLRKGPPAPVGRSRS